MPHTKISFNKKYLVKIDNVDKNKVYAVSGISLSFLTDRIESLWVENGSTINESIKHALRDCQTDKYPFIKTDAKFIYDIEQQVRDEKIVAFKTKGFNLNLRERNDF